MYVAGIILLKLSTNIVLEGKEDMQDGMTYGIFRFLMEMLVLSPIVGRIFGAW